MKRKFTRKEKVEVLAYAEKHGVSKASEKYDIRSNYIYRWRAEGIDSEVASETAQVTPKQGRMAAKEVNLESLRLMLQERLQEVERLRTVIAFLETGKL